MSAIMRTRGRVDNWNDYVPKRFVEKELNTFININYLTVFAVVCISTYVVLQNFFYNYIFYFFKLIIFQSIMFYPTTINSRILKLTN